MLAVVVVAALVVIGVAALGARVVHRDRAQVAADAAALAAVIGGPTLAAAIAASNGGAIVSYRDDGDAVTVVVELDGERATARATDGP